MIRLDKAVQMRIEAEFGIMLPRAWITRILQAGGVRYNGEVIKKKGFKLESSTDIERLILDKTIVSAIINEYKTGQVSREVASLWDNFAPLNRFDIRKDYINMVPDATKDVIFEDSNYVVMYKPPGIISHPAQDETADNMVYRYIKYMREVHDMLPRAGLLHRLDKDTQGLMVFAKNMMAFNKLKEQFNNHQVLKLYIAFVTPLQHHLTRLGKKILGITKKQDLNEFLEYWNKVQLVSDEKNIIQIARARDLFNLVFSRPKIDLSGYIAMYRFENKARFSLDAKQLKRKIFRKVKDARSEIYPVGYIERHDVVVLAVRLLTGRTHQIRAQMRYLGMPILGDRLYSSQDTSRQLTVSLGLESMENLYLHLVSFGLAFTSEDIEKKYVVLPKDKVMLNLRL